MASPGSAAATVSHPPESAALLRRIQRALGIVQAYGKTALPTMDFNSTEDHLFNRWVRENCMREAHFDTAYAVEPLDLIRAELCIQRV
jgi:hypothetical protein